MPTKDLAQKTSPKPAPVSLNRLIFDVIFLILWVPVTFLLYAGIGFAIGTGQPGILGTLLFYLSMLALALLPASVVFLDFKAYFRQKKKTK